jgi:nucleoside-diphosphate-sugar epimerase
MRIFVTGASGFVGSVVTRELLDAGHQVVGLVRSDSSASAVEAAGAEPQRGDLGDLETLSRAAAASDGVIHTAFVHDFANFAASCEIDRRAIEALGTALEGSNRPLIVTAGTVGCRTEAEAANMPDFPRKSEQAGLAFAERGVRAMVVRLPPSVHGEGDHGFVPALIRVAREQGFVSYVADGESRWAAVHRLDAARLYRLALEQGVAGARYHGVGDEGISTRELAETIGKRLRLPAVSKSPEEVTALLGLIGHVLSIDCASSSVLTQQLLGWGITQPSLLADLASDHYFAA